jgi:hypothetical protein
MPGNLKVMKSPVVILTLQIALLGCPKDDPPSREIEIVKFDSDGISLVGELRIPGGEGPHPLAIFVHGSGRATRNDYEEFVSPLDSAGIASFRYDKRGVGASGGEYSDVGPHNAELIFSELAMDAAAAVQHLKNDTRISGDKIIIIGGSQAGWIIPEINSILEPWLSVCISGPSVTVGEEIFYSDLIEKEGYSQAVADNMLRNFIGPHGYDPVSRIEKMRSPSLWFFGGKDLSIPVKKSIYILDSLMKKRKLPLVVKIYPEADHSLYNSSTKTWEAYVRTIIEWIKTEM